MDRRTCLIALVIASGTVVRAEAADAPQQPVPSATVAPARPKGPHDDVTIAAVGDILFGRYDETKKYLPVPHVDDPFTELAPEIRAADLAFCNVESPVVPEPKSFGVFKRMTFRADPEKMTLVRNAGFDVVSLANNHMFNMKAAAVPDTVANVAAAGLRPGGAGKTPADAMRPVVLDVHGVRVVFLMFTVWNNTGKGGFTKEGSLAFFEQEGKLEKTAAAEIRAARRYLGADFVIVSMHWGLEYHDHPHSGQEKLAQVMQEAGADLVLGHHPHVAQDIRWKRGQAIVFSMGNFLFDNPTLDRRETMIFHATLSQPGPLRHVSSVELEPLMIDRKTHAPGFARGKDYERWAKRLGKLAPGIKIHEERPAPAASPATSPPSPPG